MLLIGPKGSGKTTFLYQMILRKKDWEATPTQGFNYEEYVSDQGIRVGIWDVGGSDCVNIICVLNSFRVK